jgi:hypothetical protein
MSADVRIRTLDLDRLRPYLRSVAAMAKEAAESRNPKVIMTALSLLRRQHQTISELLTERSNR